MNDAQQVLRATNLELRRVLSDFGADGDQFVCECGAKECEAVIRLTGEEFDAFVATANGMPLVCRDHR